MEGYTIIESEDEDMTYDDDIDTLNLLDSNSSNYYYKKNYIDFENIKLGKNIEEKYKYAIDNKIPFKFVFNVNNKFITLEDKLKNKDLKLSYRIYGKTYNISPNNFLLLYYIANKEMMAEEFIDQLNKLEYLKMKFLGRLNMDPYLRIHIKPTQEINSIAI